MSAEQEKKFNEIIDSLEKAHTREEKEQAVNAFIEKYGMDESSENTAGEHEQTGEVDFKLYRVRNEDLLRDLHNDIKKAWAIFGDVLDEYSFPDGMKGCRFDIDFKGNKNLGKWVIEYNRIMRHLEIVADYIIKINAALENRLGKCG